MAKNIRADESVLHPATSKSSSLRTTIPSFIVSQLELKKGDKFRWYIEKGFLAIEVIHQENEK
ncbi:MAG: AbrB/MazE/SpoVT family DNA-binding domain-containing protein [Candidatus Moranbacteria bacterium]|nr:AbrB/MazE/SpoVT family DNA-binding domain-containing protein [Candidatus Moranbacteria bacterium]